YTSPRSDVFSRVWCLIQLHVSICYSSSYFIHCFIFLFNATATTAIYTLSLHDALPIFLILALLQRIFLMSSLMLLLVWLIFFMVLIKLLPILGTISGKTVKLMVLALICLGNNRQD